MNGLELSKVLEYMCAVAGRIVRGDNGFEGLNGLGRYRLRDGYCSRMSSRLLCVAEVGDTG